MMSTPSPVFFYQWEAVIWRCSGICIISRSSGKAVHIGSLPPKIAPIFSGGTLNRPSSVNGFLEADNFLLSPKIK